MINGITNHKRTSIISTSTVASPLTSSLNETLNLSSLPSELRLSGPMKKNSKVFSSSNYFINRLNSEDIVDSLIQSDIDTVLKSGDAEKIKNKVEAIESSHDPLQISSLIKGALRSGRLDIGKVRLSTLTLLKITR